MHRYEQVRVLGQGGFGKAILARRRDDQTLAVIKEVPLLSLKPKDRDDAFQEAKLLSTLSHPFIVTYIDSFQEKGNLYIAMEYADGGDLAGKLQKLGGKLMSEEEALHYFIQIALAIKYIHDRKILHRDLKTQNIFLTKDGTVKLGDFGIARVLQHTFQVCKTQIGTPYYLSPELCEGRSYNAKTDIWSLGCILYELLTLKKAFDATNMNQLIVNIIRGRHPPISSAFSVEVRQLVDAMLTKDPSKRPSINQILQLPFIKKRLSNFLNSTLLNYEMQHTILHGRKPFAEPTLLLPIKNEQNVKVQNMNDQFKFENEKANILRSNSRVLLEEQKKKLTIAQQKQAEYEEQLKQAQERRLRRLKQEAEEKERQIQELKRKEMVKRSIMENKDDLIRIPRSSPKDYRREDEIDASERRRIYLEQKAAMLRNKRRYENDSESVLRDVYGDDPFIPRKQIQYKNRPTSNMRKKTSDNDESPSKNANNNKKQDFDFKEFYRQQRREARENKKRLEEAVGMKVGPTIKEDTIQKIVKDEKKTPTNKNHNKNEKSPSEKQSHRSTSKKSLKKDDVKYNSPKEKEDVSPRRSSSVSRRVSSNHKKEEKRSLDSNDYDLSSIVRESIKQRMTPEKQGIKVEPPPQRSPNEGRGRHHNTSVKYKKSEVSAEESESVTKKGDQEKEEAEKKMSNAIQQANAIMAALEMNKNDNNDDDFANGKISNSYDNFDLDTTKDRTFYCGSQEIDLPIVRDSDSLAYRAEKIRAFLESEIGINKLIKIYRAIAEGTEREAERACAMVEPGFVILIQQLLILDDKING